MTTEASFAGADVGLTAADSGWRSRATRVAPWALGLLCAVLVAGGFSLGLRLGNLHNGLIAATFTAVGVFVVIRRRGNREGWLFIATGLAHAVMFFGRQYGLYASDGRDALPGAEWVAWLGVWPLALVLVLVGVTLMCFPDGRLPSPRWRIVVAAMMTAGALLSLVSALWPVEYAPTALSLAHPLHLAGYDTVQHPWGIVRSAIYPLFQLAWVAAIVVRLRRARGDEARQLRWFAYAVTIGAAAMAVGLLVFGSPLLGVLAVPAIALAAGVAIVKYRLYDIDLVVSKTLVVGAMAAIITAGYVVVVVSDDS